MFCSNCGNNLGDEKPNFCGNCGTPTGQAKASEKKQAPDSPAEPSESVASAPAEPVVQEVSEASEPAEPSALKKKFDELPMRLKVNYGSVIAAVLAIVIGLGFVPGLYAPLNATNMPALADQFTPEELKTIAQKHCSTLNNTVPTAETLAVYEDQIAQVKKVGEGDEGRKMKAFASKATWLAPTSTQSDFTARVDAVISAALKDTVKDVELLGLSDSNRGLMESLWSAAFTALVKSECAFKDVESATLSTLSTYDNVMSRASSVAENAPWYPKGYTVYSANPGIAWKLTYKNPYCFGCSIITAAVVTESGCPTSLYAEMNFFDGAGNQIGWTNDTTGALAPGRRADLEFRTYSRIWDLGISKFKCY